MNKEIEICFSWSRSDSSSESNSDFEYNESSVNGSPMAQGSESSFVPNPDPDPDTFSSEDYLEENKLPEQPFEAPSPIPSVSYTLVEYESLEDENYYQKMEALEFENLLSPVSSISEDIPEIINLIKVEYPGEYEFSDDEFIE